MESLQIIVEVSFVGGFIPKIWRQNECSTMLAHWRAQENFMRILRTSFANLEKVLTDLRVNSTAEIYETSERFRVE